MKQRLARSIVQPVQLGLTESQRGIDRRSTSARNRSHPRIEISHDGCGDLIIHIPPSRHNGPGAAGKKTTREALNSFARYEPSITSPAGAQHNQRGMQVEW